MRHNIFAMPGSTARDDVARTMAQKAIDLATRSLRNVAGVSWFDTTGLATGVATTDGRAPTWSGNAIVTDAGSMTDISVADITTAAAIYTQNVTGTVTDLTGVPPAVNGPPHVGAAGIGYRIHSHYAARVTHIISSGPALSAGDKVFLRFPAIKGVDGAAAEAVWTTMVLGDGGAYKSWWYALTDGAYMSTTGSMASFVNPPTTEFTDNGDGSGELTITFEANQSVSSGWILGIGPFHGTQQTSTGIEFDDAQVLVGDTSPHGGGGGGGYGLVVADPSMGSHRAALPFVLRLEAAKPGSDATVAEVLGTTGGTAGDLVVRLVVASGSPQLTVSEDGGTTIYTATTPPAAWSSAAVVEMRVADDAVELFVDGDRLTEIPLQDVPSAIDSYAVAATATMTLVDVQDADGLVIENNDPAMMLQAEYDALPIKPSYVEIFEL